MKIFNSPNLGNQRLRNLIVDCVAAKISHSTYPDPFRLIFHLRLVQNQISW